MTCMARQLTLIDTPHQWRLSEATKAAGRKGVADARATLKAALAAQASAETSSESHRTRRSAA